MIPEYHSAFSPVWLDINAPIGSYVGIAVYRVDNPNKDVFALQVEVLSKTNTVNIQQCVQSLMKYGEQSMMYRVVVPGVTLGPFTAIRSAAQIGESGGLASSVGRLLTTLPFIHVYPEYPTPEVAVLCDGSIYVNQVLRGIGLQNIAVTCGMSQVIALPYSGPERITILTTVRPDGHGTTTGAGGYNAGDLAILTAIAGEQYMFEGWYLGNLKVSSSKVYSFMVTQVATYEARFIDAIHITALVTPVNAGTITGTGYYEPSTAVTLVATSAVNREFEGWYLDGVKVSGNSSLNITVGSQNQTYEARFLPVTWRLAFGYLICQKAALDTYTVSAVSNDALAGSVSGGGVIPQGLETTVTASPAVGCYLIGWFDESNVRVSTEQSYTFTPTRDITLTARFAENGASYTISFTDFICQKETYN